MTGRVASWITRRRTSQFPAQFPELRIAFVLLGIMAGVVQADSPHLRPIASLSGALGTYETRCSSCHLAAAAEQGTGALPAWQPSVGGTYLYSTLDASGMVEQSGSITSAFCMSCHAIGRTSVTNSSRIGHPTSVPYRGGPGAPSNESTSITGSLEFWPAQRNVVDNATPWFVPVPGLVSGLPLYTGSSGLFDEAPHVECPTCHDPHGSNAGLLRVRNDGSRLCVSCHVM